MKLLKIIFLILLLTGCEKEEKYIPIPPPPGILKVYNQAFTGLFTLRDETIGITEDTVYSDTLKIDSILSFELYREKYMLSLQFEDRGMWQRVTIWPDSLTEHIFIWNY